MTRARSALAMGTVGAVAVALARLHYALRPEDVPNPYAPTHLAIAVSSLLVGTWLAWRRPDQPLVWAILAAGLLGAWMYVAQPLAVELYFANAPTWIGELLGWLVTWPWLAARSALLIAAPSLAITEVLRRPRRAVLWLGIAVTVALCAAQLTLTYNQSFDPNVESPAPNAAQRLAGHVIDWLARGQWLAGVAAVTLLAIAGLLAGGPTLRSQTKWFVLGASALGAVALGQIGRELFPSWWWPGDISELVASATLPVFLALAVVADGMFEARLIVRRAVLFGALSVIGATGYAAVTLLLAEGLGASPGVTRVLTVAAVALVLIPAHVTVQRWVDNHVYGDSNRPEVVVREIGDRLALASGARAALDAMAHGVQHAMKLPGVAIELDAGPEEAAVIAAGAGNAAIPVPEDDIESFPIEYASVRLGRLVVLRRSAGEPLRPSERALLAQLARQAGAVANDVYLDAQLRSSRQELVIAREEERRRLRADLHDGLGPTLASVALGLDAASTHVDDQRLRALLADLTTDVRAAIDDIRRLVYGLRPPALDEYGLVRAVEQYADSLNTRASGLAVAVIAEPLPSLPAAVEVAAYRITTEALTNVTRHANARQCAVTLAMRGEELWVEVADDGDGLRSNDRGVGITSMRERAEELRGHLTISPRQPGTLVAARLPIEGLVYT